MIVQTIPSVTRDSRSRVCLGEVPGDVRRRRRDRRSGTSGDAEQGHWRDRGKRELGVPVETDIFLVTTCVDTRLKVGGECKGRFADQSNPRGTGMDGTIRIRDTRKCIY